ncbi:ER membrane protein complex subunit 8 [Dermatophagoides pteronyssinus]|uniref:ER membrane protein complex subunit 8 n=1 Tax=Dermatophagoides pteronyssinus TaxID=6956 RepID=A0ABQ8JP96_DERPT|nr:ER membrane protein complex subunit 8 [Dermatophagoides pteronyssinus]
MSSDEQLETSKDLSPNNNSNDDLVISTKCYLKILMHAFRYPHGVVNGLLVMEKKKKSSGKSNRIVDCIPLFHSGHGLTPMLEVALNQVSNYLQNNTNYIIGGYYQANDHFHEIPAPIPTVFAERISDKINEINPESVMIMLNDYNLATSIDNAEKLDQPLFLYNYVDAIKELIFQKQYHLNIVDFDLHLENCKHDWRNIKLNEIIDKFEI